jgi:hypothetical protein
VCESLVMDFSMEQRLAIKFCFKAGKSATETLQMVKAAYGDQALSRSNVFRWYGGFRGGREDTEDDPSSGRPTESRNDNNVEKISQMLLQKRHISLKILFIMPVLKLSRRTVYITLYEIRSLVPNFTKIRQTVCWYDVTDEHA